MARPSNLKPPTELSPDITGEYLDMIARDRLTHAGSLQTTSKRSPNLHKSSGIDLCLDQRIGTSCEAGQYSWTYPIRSVFGESLCRCHRIWKNDKGSRCLHPRLSQRQGRNVLEHRRLPSSHCRAIGTIPKGLSSYFSRRSSTIFNFVFLILRQLFDNCKRWSIAHFQNKFFRNKTLNFFMRFVSFSRKVDSTAVYDHSHRCILGSSLSLSLWLRPLSVWI